jgi:hypothetical protein
MYMHMSGIMPVLSYNKTLPFRNACDAVCIATMEEEHAVSMVIAGPSRL